MRLTRVYFSSFSTLVRNFKSHQRHVFALLFDKKLAPPHSLDMQHGETGEREVYRQRIKDIRDRYSRKGAGYGTDGEDQRSGEYLTNSGIVNYAMQISKRHAASAIQRRVCGSCIQSAAVVFIIWDVQCFANIVSCLGITERLGKEINMVTYSDYLYRRWISRWILDHDFWDKSEYIWLF